MDSYAWSQGCPLTGGLTVNNAANIGYIVYYYTVCKYRAMTLTLFKAGFLPKQRNENIKTAGKYTSTSATRTVKN